MSLHALPEQRGRLVEVSPLLLPDAAVLGADGKLLPQSYEVLRAGSRPPLGLAVWQQVLFESASPTTGTRADATVHGAVCDGARWTMNGRLPAVRERSRAPGTDLLEQIIHSMDQFAIHPAARAIDSHQAETQRLEEIASSRQPGDRTRTPKQVVPR